MNANEVKGSWEEKKGKLKQRFAILTHDDIMFAGGNIEELYNKLQIKLGKTKEEFRQIIESL
ncbi:MAG TPA: CsbD family protein [Draconibacterium sp.]|nr:CsbD family protein [Draconibacterium sp.]